MEAPLSPEDTVDRMFKDRARFVAGVERGIAQADAGEVVEHQDVVDRIQRLLQV
jgi:predicted transcriptional regulator